MRGFGVGVVLGLALSVGCVGAVAAHQIVPVHIDTPGGFGPQRAFVPAGCTIHFDLPSLRAIRCPITVPDGTVEIAGWGGYAVDLGPFDPSVGPLGYMSIEVWHDGGTPHRLDQPHYWTPGGTLGPVFLPAGDGHHCVPGDKVFAIFWCVGFSGSRQPWCAESLTVHFRIVPAGQAVKVDPPHTHN